MQGSGTEPGGLGTGGCQRPSPRGGCRELRYLRRGRHEGPAAGRASKGTRKSGVCKTPGGPADKRGRGWASSASPPGCRSTGEEWSVPWGDARCLGVMLLLGAMLVYEVMLGLVAMLVLITPHTNSIFAAPTCRQGWVEHEPSELWGWGGTGRGLRVLRGSRVGAAGGPVGWGRSGCWHAVAPSLRGCQLSPHPNPKNIPRGQEPTGKGQIHPLLGLPCPAARHLPASSALPR